MNDIDRLCVDAGVWQSDPKHELKEVSTEIFFCSSYFLVLMSEKLKKLDLLLKIVFSDSKLLFLRISYKTPTALSY
jgi:hypothetical protein